VNFPCFYQYCKHILITLEEIATNVNVYVQNKVIFVEKWSLPAD